MYHTLREYESRRIPRTTRVVNDSWRADRAFQLENLIACRARNWLIILMPGNSQLARMLVYAGYEVPDLRQSKGVHDDRHE